MCRMNICDCWEKTHVYVFLPLGSVCEQDIFWAYIRYAQRKWLSWKLSWGKNKFFSQYIIFQIILCFVDILSSTVHAIFIEQCIILIHILFAPLWHSAHYLYACQQLLYIACMTFLSSLFISVSI